MKKIVALFLIALCLVSCYHTDKQTINALVIANQSLMDTKKIIEADNKSLMYSFEREYNRDPIKVKSYYELTKMINSLSDSLVNEIDHTKAALVKESDGMSSYADDSIEHISNKDEVSKANSILLYGADSKASILKKRIVSYRKRILNVLHDNKINSSMKDTLRMNIGLLTPEGKNESWEESNFGHMPLVADLAVLTRLQIDIRNCQANFNRYLYSDISSSSGCGIADFVIYFDRYAGQNTFATHEQLDSIDRISFFPRISASFEMNFIEKGKSIILSSNSVVVTQEMRNELKKLKKGDQVIIQNVAIQDPTGYIRKYKGPTITVE